MADPFPFARRPGRAFAALLLGDFLLAFGPWMVRLADVGPLAAGFWRLTLALPVIVLLAWRGGGGLPSRRASVILFAGGLFFAADLGAWHLGIFATKLANATLFGNVASFFFAIYGFVVIRRLPGVAQLVAFVLAAAGVALLLGRSAELSPAHLRGDLLCILAGLFYTGYLIAIDRVGSAVRPSTALALATAAGAPALLAFALLRGEAVWPHDWLPLVALAVGSQVLGQGLFVYAIPHLEPVVVGVALLAQPVIAAAIGWFAYDERLGLADLAGALAIAAAIVLVRRRAAVAPSGADPILTP